MDTHSDSSITKAHRRLQNITNCLFPNPSSAEVTKSPDLLKFRVPLEPDVKPFCTSLNPVHFLLRAAQINTSKLAVDHGTQQYSYGQLAERTKNFACALKTHYHIKPGDRVAILAPNIPALLEAHFAIPAARAIIVAINTRLRHDEVKYILQHSSASLILIDKDYVESSLPPGLDIPVIRIDDSGLPSDPYEQFLEIGVSGSWSDLPQVTDELSVIAIGYTSGTTGKPKGVMTTYRGAYLAALGNCIESEMVASSGFLWTLPLFHCNGWTFCWAVTAVAATHIMLRRIDPACIWDLLRRPSPRVTHYNGAPTVHISIVNHPAATRLEYPVKVTVAGSAPTPALIAQMETLNMFPIHVYGLTETYGPSVKSYRQPDFELLLPDERARLLARQGHGFVVSDEVRVVNPDTMEDTPLDGYTVGEIVFRGNIVMKGYLDDPEATDKAFKGGWFHSGDLAVRYSDGSISIQDRSKDVIISGGENISSLEVESTLAHYPEILEVAVIAGPHPKWGEVPIAFIVLKAGGNPGKEIERKILEFVKPRLAGFKRPSKIHIVKELPKTSTGKIQKFVLREQLWKDYKKRIN